jgi:5-methylcytosine-specific restriction endonuclease McrA
MTTFELRRLLDYDDESILGELRRVSDLIKEPTITTQAFDRLSKVHSSTIRRRFGGWHRALEKVGLAHRYSGAIVTERMRKGCPVRHTDEKIINQLRTVANKLGSVTFTAKKFDELANIHSYTAVRHFGSWAAALTKAGLTPGRGRRRYTEDDYFENILTVWTHYGRQPKYIEMDLPPSLISSGAYEAKFGKWTNALRVFLARMESDSRDNLASKQNVSVGYDTPNPSVVSLENFPHERRPIKLGIRYEVLKRDRFRCVLCGASPATDPVCQLHVDHIIPISRHGVTVTDNLRTLCSKCNIGKGSKSESSS